MPHLDILHLPGEPAPGHYVRKGGTTLRRGPKPWMGALPPPFGTGMEGTMPSVYSAEQLQWLLDPVSPLVDAWREWEASVRSREDPSKEPVGFPPRFPVIKEEEEEEPVTRQEPFLGVRGKAQEQLAEGVRAMALTGGPPWAKPDPEEGPYTSEEFAVAKKDANFKRFDAFLDYVGVQEEGFVGDLETGKAEDLLDYDDFRHIASEAVDGMIYGGELDEKYRENAIEYFMSRMGSRWADEQNTVMDQNNSKKERYPITPPHLAIQFAGAGLEGEDQSVFIGKEMQDRFEDQIGRWEEDLKAFPKAPFIVDPKGQAGATPGKRMFDGEEQILGKFGQVIVAMLTQGALTPNDLSDEENLPYFTALRYSVIPEMMNTGLDTPFALVETNWQQWVTNEYIGKGPDDLPPDSTFQTLKTWNRNKGQLGPDDVKAAQIETMLRDNEFGKAVRQVILGSGFNTALLDAIDDDVLQKITQDVKDFKAYVRSLYPNKSEDEVNQIVATYAVVRGKTALPLTKAKKSHDTNVALAKQFRDNAGDIVKDFINQKSAELGDPSKEFNVPDGVKLQMEVALKDHGADSLTALEDDPNHAVANADDILSNIYNENIRYITDLEQKAAAKKTREEREKAHDDILKTYDVPKAVAAWNRAHADRDLSEEEIELLEDPDSGLAAKAAAFIASDKYGSVEWEDPVYGSRSSPYSGVEQIDIVLGTTRGIDATRLGAAEDWTVGHTEEWVSARGFRVSTNDIDNITKFVRDSGNVAYAQTQIAANIEAGHYEEAFLWEQARTDPDQFVWQHLESTGVITVDSSRAFLDHLQNNVIVELVDKLTIRMNQSKPLEDIKGFVADTIRDTVPSFDLDESKFPKTEDERFFSYDERLGDLSGFPGTTQLPMEGALPSTQRARLSGSELDPALASLYETEDPNFLDFLFQKTGDDRMPQVDELLKGYSYAAVPQVNEEEMRSIANLAYEQRDLQTRASDASRGEPVYRGTGDDPVALASNFGNLTNLQIGRKAEAAATTPGLTPQEYIASQMSGLKKEYADSPLFASAIQQQKSRWAQEAELREYGPGGKLGAEVRASAEARLPKPVRRFPTRFRKVRA